MKEAAPARPIYLAGLRLRNIRGFRELALDLRAPGASHRPATLFIGRNGTCKTTLVRAIALGLADRSDAAHLIGEPIGGMVSEGEREGWIELDLVGGADEAHTRVRKQLVREGDKEHFGDEQVTVPGAFACGYGAGRFRVGPESGRSYRVADSVAGLFRSDGQLIDPELTLRRLNDFLGDSAYESTLAGLKRVLGLGGEDRIELPRGGGVFVSGPSVGASIPLAAWADGYRVTFSWMLDAYAWAMRARRVTPQGGMQGIILVDEIEQHLHPSMQARVLPRIREVLPEVQLIATTHSPLVALGARPAELVALHRRQEQVVVDAELPDLSAYSAEDVLVDERLFDTEAYAPETNALLREYRDLVSIAPGRRSRGEQERLRELAVKLAEQQLPEGRDSQVAAELRELIQRHGL